MRWRRLILKFHLYSGLVCFWYLIILGTSSLNFNHHFSFMESEVDPKTWSKSIPLTNNFQDDLSLSQAIRDSLSLIGWPLPWETWHDTTGVFHFALQHPGKRYVIDYSFDDQVAKVAESPRSLWATFNSLHAAGAVPNSLFMTSWRWYLRITVSLLIVSVFLGIYLWYDNQRDKKVGWLILIASVALSLVWMMQLYFIG